MSGFLLHLLRHGEPMLAGRLIGRTDCAPTADGITACLQKAAGLDVAALISSDLRRALYAGEAIAAALSLPLSLDPAWRELDFGDWDGLSPGDVDPQAMADFWSDPERHPPPGGERWSSLVERVEKAIHALAPRPTLVVTHAGAMRAALAVLCGLGHREAWAFDLPYASLLSLRVWPGPDRSAQIVALQP